METVVECRCVTQGNKQQFIINSTFIGQLEAFIGKYVKIYHVMLKSRSARRIGTVYVFNNFNITHMLRIVVDHGAPYTDIDGKSSEKTY